MTEKTFHASIFTHYTLYIVLNPIQCVAPNPHTEKKGWDNNQNNISKKYYVGYY